MACENISFPNKFFHILECDFFFTAPGFLLIQQHGWFNSEQEHLWEMAP